MDVEFENPDLDRLETDTSFTMKLAPELVRTYRKRMQAIRAAADERDLRSWKSWRYEKLQGKRQHQSSIRLNDRYRLIVELEMAGSTKRVRIVGIEDYH